MKELEFGERIDGIDYIIRPGVYGICFRRHLERLEVAVVKTPGGYFLPGGGIEEGENHELCLKREFIEETGYQIKVGKFLGKSNQVGFTPRSKRYLHLKGNFYLVDILTYVGGISEADHEFCWIPYTDQEKLIRLDYQKYAIKEAYDHFQSI